MSGAQPDSDIVVLLTHDHDVLRHLLTGFGDSDEALWGEKFQKLTNFLVRHEVAEERVVHPALRQDVLPGEAVATALLAEEADAEELLATLEKLDVGSTAFAGVLDELQDLVLVHMRDEETRLVPLLRDLEEDVRRSELGAAYTRAMLAAPTHPHPHAPDTPPGNAVMGPIAALVDRVRDAVNAHKD